MFGQLIRSFKRFTVLIPGIIVAYFVFKNFYPVVDRRVPAALAIFITYVITAYGLIPLAVRLIRLFVTTDHIPLYSTTPDGFASDPINIALVGTKKEVISAMTNAGWHLADKRTFKTLSKMGWSMLFNKPYLNAPFSNLYLLGRKQDLGFQLPAGNNPSYRHHVRFWATNLQPNAEVQHHHIRFWQRLHQPVVPGRIMWVGAASQDIGIRPVRHNLQLTHLIHHDTNAERDLIVKSLKDAKQVKSIRTVKASRPYSVRNRVLGGYLSADGDLKLCLLKP